MSTQPARTDTTTPRRDGFPPAVGAATVTVVQRRAGDVVQGDVIALPDEVFVPVPARAGPRRTWVWHSKPSHLLDNAHRWRWVYDVDQPDEDEDEVGLAASLPLGFRLLRVSDDRPDQGQQYRSLVIAVRDHDLVDIQVRTEHRQPQRLDQVSATAASSSGDFHPSAGTADRFTEFTARDATVRVFDRSTEVDSDDASDMYVLEVLGVSVLVRLRTTRAHPSGRPQVYVHVDNETREPTSLAVEVAGGGDTDYRI
jgi:hypothetical protein